MHSAGDTDTAVRTGMEKDARSRNDAVMQLTVIDRTPPARITPKRGADKHDCIRERFSVARLLRAGISR